MVDDRDGMLIDALLVLRVRSGDREAARLLVERWDARLRTHAVHLLGDRHAGADAAQDAWVAIVRRLGSLSDPERFGPWAIRIVTNKCRDIQRRHPFRASDQLDSMEEETPCDPWNGRAAEVRVALRSLPADQRALLSLRYAARLSLVAIGEAMGLPIGTVKSRLHAARSGVRDFIEQPHRTDAAAAHADGGVDDKGIEAELRKDR